MRRYAILILTVFIIAAAAVAGISYPVGADKKIAAVPLTELTAYTTLPAETVSILADAYEKETHVRVNFVPMAPGDLLQKVQDDAVSDPTVVKTVDVVLTDGDVLKRAADLNLFTPNVSESNDAVGKNFKDEHDRWTGLWYDPIVFCANKDYLRKVADIPDTWQKLSQAENVRIGITDFLAADASANLMFQMIGQFGDVATYQILSGLHPKIVQYARYLSNPVRQAGMGEVDVSVAVESETLRYLQNGYPLKIIYPADGTAYMLTGLGISTKDADKIRAAANFSDWLLSDEAQLALRSNGFYFIPTNPGTLAYKTFAGKNLLLFDNNQTFDEKQRGEFLDKWVKQVRLVAGDR